MAAKSGCVALLLSFAFSIALAEPDVTPIDRTPILFYNGSEKIEKTSPSSSKDSRSEFPHIARALSFAGGLLKDVDKLVNSVASIEDGRFVDRTACSRPMDCAEIYLNGKHRKDGLYKIWPRSRISKDYIWVHCDMEKDGGGWTLIQRRGDFDSAEDYFYKTWDNYKTGFGDLTKDFWIGNDNIFALTNQRSNTIRFVLTDWEGNTTHAEYDTFWLDDEDHKYTLHVSGYRGTAGDSFTNVDNAPFTTKDQDNDKHESNCAVLFKGAWWYTSCHASNLNGNYLKGKHESYADGVEWNSFKGLHYSLKDTFMKVRPKDYTEQLKDGPQ